MRADHQVRVLTDAHDAWQVLLGDIGRAKVSILIEMYMLVDDAAGQIFVAALGQAVARGVDVRMTIDAVGSLDVAGNLPEQLDDVGVKWRLFNPVTAQTPWKHWLQRNHRKLMVFDEQVAHIGGRNVGEKYYAMTPGEPVWLDLGARVEGPCVAPMAAVLRAHWRKVPRVKAPPPSVAGPTLVTHAFNLGGSRKAFANRRMLQAVRSAKQSIHLVQAYFLPNWALQRALVSAARRGVDVRVIVPDLRTSDVPIVALGSEHGVGRLLKRGVRVFALTRGVMHAKFMVIDGKWWTIGSANMDPLSRLRNLEANIVGIGEAEAGDVELYFDQIAAMAEELSWDKWQQRPLLRRMGGAILWRLRGLA